MKGFVYILFIQVQSSNTSLSYCVENKGNDKMKFLGQLLVLFG